MAASDFVVFVVEGEATARTSTAALVSSLGFECRTFSSAKQCLDVADLTRPGCAVVDLHLEGMNAFQLQERLAESGIAFPILFVGANITVREAVQAMCQGAFSVLEKPYGADELANVIQKAAAISRYIDVSRRRMDALRARFETLDPRERDVMAMVVSGIPTKTIARKLGVCQRTATYIRAEVYKKMDVESPVDLAAIAGDLSRIDDKGIAMHADISGRSTLPNRPIELPTLANGHRCDHGHSRQLCATLTERSERISPLPR
jgi:FixJ family two-component response regulator